MAALKGRLYRLSEADRWLRRMLRWLGPEMRLRACYRQWTCTAAAACSRRKQATQASRNRTRRRAISSTPYLHGSSVDQSINQSINRSKFLKREKLEKLPLGPPLKRQLGLVSKKQSENDSTKRCATEMLTATRQMSHPVFFSICFHALSYSWSSVFQHTLHFLSSCITVKVLSKINRHGSYWAVPTKTIARASHRALILCVLTYKLTINNWWLIAHPLQRKFWHAPSISQTPLLRFVVYSLDNKSYNKLYNNLTRQDALGLL